MDGGGWRPLTSLYEIIRYAHFIYVCDLESVVHPLLMVSTNFFCRTAPLILTNSHCATLPTNAAFVDYEILFLYKLILLSGSLSASLSLLNTHLYSRGLRTTRNGATEWSLT